MIVCGMIIGVMNDVIFSYVLLSLQFDVWMFVGYCFGVQMYVVMKFDVISLSDSEQKIVIMYIDDV